MEAPECPFCHKKEWRHICSEKVIPGKRVVGVQEKKETAFVCPICEARKARDRERVRKWRAKK